MAKRALRLPRRAPLLQRVDQWLVLSGEGELAFTGWNSAHLEAGWRPMWASSISPHAAAQPKEDVVFDPARGAALRPALQHVGGSGDRPATRSTCVRLARHLPRWRPVAHLRPWPPVIANTGTHQHRRGCMKATARSSASQKVPPPSTAWWLTYFNVGGGAAAYRRSRVASLARRWLLGAAGVRNPTCPTPKSWAGSSLAGRPIKVWRRNGPAAPRRRPGPVGD